MRRYWNYLRRLVSSTTRPRTPVRRRPTTRLCLESLEDRIVPTIVFEPYFGNESVTYHGGPVLNDAPVYLIYWGSYWNTQAGSTQETQYTTAIRNELNSPLFGNLSQYNNAGPAYLLNTYNSKDADPTNGFSDATLQSVVLDAMSDPNSNIDIPASTEWQDGGHAPIYLVITPPNIDSYRNSNVGGYHSNFIGSPYNNGDSMNMVYAWVENSSNTAMGLNSTQDFVTMFVSHEIGEALTDPYPATDQAYQATAGASWPGGGTGEIGDFEPNLAPYTYRLNGVNGQLVQALWDENANAFTVSDGNSQNFYLLPQYNASNQYTFSNTLVISGDQLGSNYNDTVTINTTSSGGVTVTLNGQTATFDAGQISEIYVFAGGGYNTINILGTPSGVPTYVNSIGDDTVTVGNTASSQGSNGSMAGIQGSVDVFGSGSIVLNVDDSGDPNAQTVSMHDGTISYGSAASIFYTATSSSSGGVTSLSIYGGSGGNTYNVYSTSRIYTSTWLDSGTGNETVNVYATNGYLDDYNPGGTTKIYVGLGNMTNINGPVNAYAAGATLLYLNDSNDTTARTVTMGDGYLYGLGGTGAIYWTPTSSATGGVYYLQIDGGSGGNTYNVYNTSDFLWWTQLNTGMGDDTVNVYATSGALNDDNTGGADSTYVGLGNMTGINGPIYVYGAGTTFLVLNDSNDTTGSNVTMGDGYLYGLGGSNSYIYWTPTSSWWGGGVSYLAVDGGSGGNTFNVENTSNFGYWTYLSTGTGNDTVNVYATTGTLFDYNPGGTDYTDLGVGNMSGINGNVNVSGSGATNLILDDSNDTTGCTVSMNNGSVSGLGGGAGTIYWTPSSSATGGVTYLAIYGGSGGNTFNVYDTSDFYYYTYLYAGSGYNIVNVYGTGGEFIY
ncbi:MAG: hypothetical protein ACYC3I_23200 [Gemmataceae bacterium]